MISANITCIGYDDFEEFLLSHDDIEIISEKGFN